MAARPIVVPFTVFTDSNGTPLDNGYIYIGTAGLNPETNPINVYLDSALTIPIAQPIRTLSGYPSANGSPAQLYIDFVDYSITIRDRNGVFVVSTQNAVVQLAAGNITNTPAGNIAATDVQSAINELDTEKAALSGANFTGAVNGTNFPMTQEFRPTLTTGVPVTTSDVTAATTLYCTPYKGNRISLYTGTAWVTLTSAEFSIALGTLTSGIGYDFFCYDNSGVPTLELTAWASATARATALDDQDGVLVKSGAPTRRYIGSFLTTSTTTTEDSLANRYLYSYCHRVARPMRAVDTTNSWTYTTASFRQAKANAANQLNFFVGVVEDVVKASCYGRFSNSASSGLCAVGIGQNSTTTNAAQIVVPSNSYSTQSTNTEAHFSGVPALGLNSLVWLEASVGIGTTTWDGDAGGTFSQQAGIIGEVMA